MVRPQYYLREKGGRRERERECVCVCVELMIIDVFLSMQELLAHYVSLIPFLPDAITFSGECDIWTTSEVDTHTHTHTHTCQVDMKIESKMK